MKKMKLVMVGNGMAGVRTLEELLKIAPELYDVTVFGAEPHPNYNRILLSPVLAGEMTIQEIVLNELDWYRGKGIALHTGRNISKIDRVKRKVIADENQLRYNGMLISVFELLADARDQISAVTAAIDAQQQFWLADAAIQASVIGRPTNTTLSVTSSAPSAGDAGH